MLKNLDPALNAEVLHALRSMGHADRLVVADANFPSDNLSRYTTVGRPLRMDNITSSRAIQAILSVFPLDTPLQPSVGRMEVMGDAGEIPEVQAEVQAIVNAAEGGSAPMYSIERFAFYDIAKETYCIIETGETRFYGCFVLTKGVIPPS